MLARPPRPRPSQRALRLLEQIGPDHECVEGRGPEALDGVARRADDRFAARVERGINQYRYPGLPLERGDEVVVEGVLRAGDRLDTSGAVDVTNGRDAIRHLIAHVVDEEHVWGVTVRDEPLRGLFGEDYRRHRAEILPVLDLVEPGLHVGVDGRGQDRSRPEGPGAELHAPLEPAEDAAGGQ